ncbi:Lipin/Ned1/Smp2-domain-containing protein [Melampsora americana]|nr:Lipin/Ned1/Smp2-domain-containing protein [Melampsora americana]
MSWLGRAISSVGQYYKEINPATLSGAIDVIVISNKRTTSSNQDDNQTIIEDLACSPWHVRFGKLSVLRPVERKVRILINDQPAPFSMKIGETGEAFFVFETDVEDLPDDLQTSPLVSPCLESVESTSKRDPTSTNLEVVPDFNDLGESELANDPTQEWATDCKGEVQDSCESVLPEKNQKNSELDQSSQTSPEADLINTDNSLKSSDSPQQEDSSVCTENVIPTMSLLINTDQTVPPSPHEDGDEARQAARAQDPHPLISQVSPTSQISSEAELHTALPHHLHHGTNLPPGDLMLDMDGYKMTEDTEDDNLSRNNSVPHFTIQKKTSPSKSFDLKPPSSTSSYEFTNVKEEDVMEFTKALLTCSERINNQLTPNPNQNLSGDQIDHNVAVIIDSLQKEPVDQSTDKPQLADNLKSDSVSDRDSDCIIYVERIEGTNGSRTYDRFKLDFNGTFHTFEISFYTPSFEEKLESASHHHHHHHCIRPRSFDHQQFNQNRMCFDDYFTTPDLKDAILDQEANLVVKYNELSILTWDNASTALTSLGIYRKSILSLSQTKTLRLSNGVVRIVDPTLTDSMIPLKNPTINSSDQTLVSENPRESSAQAGYPSSSIDQSEKPMTTVSPVSTSYTRPWSRWWYKNDQLTSTHTHHVRHHSEVAFTSNNEELNTDEDKLGSHSSAHVSLSASPRSLPIELDGDRSSENERGQQNDKQRSSSAEGKSREETNQSESPTTPTTPPPRKHYAKTLRLTSDQLKQLGLKKGMNQVSFSVRSSYSGYAVCTSRIFLWESDYKICISDIDGTITKSDALGHVFTMIGRDWTHAGVAKLYTDIAKNGYKLMYLTSRAIGQADTTREYLKGINQLGYTLPDGPVIMSPDRLMTSLHREVIMRKPEVFKMACLRDIQRLFGKPNRKPFYAGFGNRITDALSYRTVEIPSSRIFTIDSNGEVKMELLELTGYKSSYIHMTDLVDQMFPPINRSSNSLPEFTDFNFWRSDPSTGSILNELDLEELLSPNFQNLSMPISPALSARSYESGPTAVSRLSFRLASSLSLGRKSSKVELNSQTKRTSTSRDGSPGPKGGGGGGGGSMKGRLESDVGSLRSFETVMEEESEGNEIEQVPIRMRSDSMPGSLPGSLEEQSLLEGLRRPNESFEIHPRRIHQDLIGKGDLKSRKEVKSSEEEEEEVDDDEEVLFL